MSPHHRPPLKTYTLIAAALAILIWATLGAPGGDAARHGTAFWSVARNAGAPR